MRELLPDYAGKLSRSYENVNFIGFLSGNVLTQSNADNLLSCKQLDRRVDVSSDNPGEIWKQNFTPISQKNEPRII